MTVNMDLTQLYRAQMAMDKTYKDVNLQAAEDVGKRSELGYFDVEFTMYGCAYLNPDDEKMYYKVSSKAEDIYDFIENAAQKKIYAGNIMQMTEKAPVPSGMRHLIAQDVKLELAGRLQVVYPKEFFMYLYQLAEEIRCDTALEYLWEEAESLEGVFDEEQLIRYETLVRYACSCCKIKEHSYEALMQWIRKERSNMYDNFNGKSTHEKTMYGIAYEENGKIRYAENAQRDFIYKKMHMLEQQGKLVTPVYSKTFWYNYSYRLADVVKDFKELLRKEVDEIYVEKIKKLKGETNLVIAQELQQAITEVREKWGEQCAETLMRYAQRWNIKPL